MPLIRPTREGDTALLPDIERSSGEVFRTIPELAWIADDDVQSAEAHREFLRTGLSVVAVDADDRPIAFLCAGITGDAMHISQLAVTAECQGQGLGRSLMLAAIAHARVTALAAVTLTTFAWIDKEAGLVRIPIKRAMDMIVERGADALGPVDAPEAVPSPARPAPPQLGQTGTGNRNVGRSVP